jgi:hypothetical protein
MRRLRNRGDTIYPPPHREELGESESSNSINTTAMLQVSKDSDQQDNHADNAISIYTPPSEPVPQSRKLQKNPYASGFYSALVLETINSFPPVGVPNPNLAKSLSLVTMLIVGYKLMYFPMGLQSSLRAPPRIDSGISVYITGPNRGICEI